MAEEAENAFRDLAGMTVAELSELAVSLGEKKFRGEQIFRRLHAQQAVSYEEMKELPGAFRDKLAVDYPLRTVAVERVQRSSKANDFTEKYLLKLFDGQCVEAVLMKYSYGYSLCISSQVGCRMGCKFCASTLGGLVRNLSAGEMCGEVYAVERASGEKVSHIVIMGCGEPFDNYENLLRFFELIHAEQGKGLSLRNITVSTCGLVPKIREFAELDSAVTLAVSLHAPNDEIRKKTMKIAQAYSMKELLDACKYYTKKTNKRITFEYALMHGINDSPRDARELAARLQPILCHVNLIPINPVEECGMVRPSKNDIQAFMTVLEERHVPVTLRREMGTDIDGACGQLRHKAANDEL